MSSCSRDPAPTNCFRLLKSRHRSRAYPTLYAASSPTLRRRWMPPLPSLPLAMSCSSRPATPASACSSTSSTGAISLSLTCGTCNNSCSTLYTLCGLRQKEVPLFPQTSYIDDFHSDLSVILEVGGSV